MAHRQRVLTATRFILLVHICSASTWLSCTPIRGISSGAQQVDGGSDSRPPGVLGAGSAPRTENAGTSGSGPAQDEEAVPQAACDQGGRVACKAKGSFERLSCKDGHWKPFQDCKESERCYAALGVDAECQPLSAICIGRELGKAFCDLGVVRVCTDVLSSMEIPCGVNERCRSVAGTPDGCRCVPGAIASTEGCMLASDCSPGACDALTQCTANGGQRTCSMCPAGYTGDGVTGCLPSLLTLTSSCGTLAPALTLGVFDYGLPVGLFCQQVTLTTTVPDNVQVTINGEPVPPATAWTSGMLGAGDNPITITLTSSSGVSSKYNLNAQVSGVQEGYLRAPTPDTLDNLGASIAIDGDTIVAGAPNDDGAVGGINGDQSDSDAMNSGAAYVYVRQAGAWVAQATLKADRPFASEYFGASVAILGDLIAVGATGNDPTAQPTISANRGAVYLFARSAGVWTPAGKVTAQDATGGDMFGFQVILTADRLLVTAPFEGSQIEKSGAAYVFTRAADGWTELTKLKSSQPVKLSGWGSGLAYDGNTIVVGAFSDSSAAEFAGSATVFTQQGGTWTEQQRLLAQTPTKDATFGWTAAVLGDVIAIGAPRWQHFLPTPSGEVYIFQRTGSLWSQTEVLAPVSPRRSDYFGSSLVLTPSILLVGANGDASASGGLQADPKDGSMLSAGAVYVFGRNQGQFVRTMFLKAAQPTAGDSFGVSIGLSGGTLAVGSAYDDVSDSGALYVIH